MSVSAPPCPGCDDRGEPVSGSHDDALMFMCREQTCEVRIFDRVPPSERDKPFTDGEPVETYSGP